jgi:hypothetical protein
MIKSLVTSLTIALALVACATKEKPLPELPSNEFVIVHPDRVEPVEMKNVDWQVWNRDRLIKEGEDASNADKVYYVLTDTQFGNLMENLIDVSGTISKLKKSVDYYKKSIDEYNVKRKKDEVSKNAR